MKSNTDTSPSFWSAGAAESRGCDWCRAMKAYHVHQWHAGERAGIVRTHSWKKVNFKNRGDNRRIGGKGGEMNEPTGEDKKKTREGGERAGEIKEKAGKEMWGISKHTLLSPFW